MVIVILHSFIVILHSIIVILHSIIDITIVLTIAILPVLQPGGEVWVGAAVRVPEGLREQEELLLRRHGLRVLGPGLGGEGGHLPVAAVQEPGVTEGGGWSCVFITIRSRGSLHSLHIAIDSVLPNPGQGPQSRLEIVATGAVVVGEVRDGEE